MGLRWSSSSGSVLRFGALLALAGAALSAVGCKETACVQWSDDRGSCPSQEEALAYLTPSCDELHVRRVLSEADYAEGMCCYDVEKTDNNTYVCGGFAELGVEDRPPPPDGPASSSSSGSTDPECIGCNTAVTDANADLILLCPASALLYDDLASCVCVETCANECGDTACSGIQANDVCLECWQSACASELDRCIEDL